MLKAACITWAILVMLIVLLFEGWASHNLDRHNWLWVAAIAVLAKKFVWERKDARQRVAAAVPQRV